MYPIPSKRMVYVVLKARGLLVYNRKHAVLPVVISCSTRHFITAFQRMKHALCIRYLLPVVVPVQIFPIGCNNIFIPVITLLGAAFETPVSLIILIHIDKAVTLAHFSC
jgi:hypothetical protein